ncbi:unnamed protein product [Dovyalis caffra]|uniref:Cyclin-dependent kinase inhibitor n=1 Tax=Dovyalis caffra TaxID=77055 RepID=A0AAV1RLT3_9ROSI|nr:unnamed protein product [Dovyalis caffra]
MVKHSCHSKGRKAIEELAMVKVAAQAGVRSRARSLRSAIAKKRSRHVKVSIKVRSNVTNSTGQQRVAIRSENSVSFPPEVNAGHRTVTEERCSSPSLDDVDDHASMSASCCSSNGSCDERIKFADLEEERVEAETAMYYSSNSGERERTPTSSAFGEESTSENMESTANPAVILKKQNSHQISSTDATVIRITDEEVEKFFGEIEKNVPQRLKDKVKDLYLSIRSNYETSDGTLHSPEKMISLHHNYMN